MESHAAGHALSALIFLPLATAGSLLALSALMAALFGSRGLPASIWWRVGFAGSVGTFVFAGIEVAGRFDAEHIGFQMQEHRVWLPTWGVHYFVAIDGISLGLVLLTGLLVPLVWLAAWKQDRRSPRGFVLLLLCIESGLLGALLSLNLLLFFFFWELTAIATALLLLTWGGARRVSAATRLVLFTGLGSFALLLALLVLAGIGFEQGDAWNLDLVAVRGSAGRPLLEIVVPADGAGGTWWSSQGGLFAAFALAFGIQLPLFPLHGWLVGAQSQTPGPGRVLIVGLCLALGGYGFLRFALPLFPDAALASAPFLSALALAGILYGSLGALRQRDLLRLLACLALAQLGYVALGLFSLDGHGLTGSVVHMLSSGLVMAGLLLAVEFIEERRRSTAIADFGGLAKPMPVFAAGLGILVLAACGLPGLSGFVGEFLVLLGCFREQRELAVAACAGGVLVAGVLLWLYRRIALGPVEHPENRGLIDLDWRERGILLALLVPIVAIGVHPNPVLRRIEPAVLELLRTLEERRTLLPLPAEEEAGTLARARLSAEAGG